MRPSRLSILEVRSFYAPFAIFIGIRGGRVRRAGCLGSAEPVHGTSPHPSTLAGSASAILSPTCPTLAVCGFALRASGRACGPFQPGDQSCRAAHGRAAPSVSGPSPEKTFAVHVHEPSGISKLGFEGRAPLAHRRTGTEGRTAAPADEVYVWRRRAARARAMTETTCHQTCVVPRRHSFRLRRPSYCRLGQNQAARNAPYQLQLPSQGPPQPYVQFPASAAIKARNPRLLRKQTQHH